MIPARRAIPDHPLRVILRASGVRYGRAVTDVSPKVASASWASSTVEPGRWPVVPGQSGMSAWMVQADGSAWSARQTLH